MCQLPHCLGHWRGLRAPVSQAVCPRLPQHQVLPSQFGQMPHEFGSVSGKPRLASLPTSGHSL